MPARFAVHVVPRARHPGPAGRHGEVPRVRVAAPPEGDRANAEVERTLSELLGCPVRVVAGRTARRKICEVELDRAELLDRLWEAFGG